MSALSKLAGGVFGLKILPNNCHEMAHTWNPDCFGATMDVTRAAAIYSLKVYTALYALTTLLKRPRSHRDISWRRLVRDIVQSSAFLTTHAFLYIGALCASRQAIGFFTWPMVGALNSAIACSVSILIERKNRRAALALYFANLASEVGFNAGVEAGWWPSIPKGQVLVFATALAGFSALLHRDELNEDVAKVFRLVFGPSSAGALSPALVPGFLQAALDRLRRARPPAPLCRHPHSCVSSALEKFAHKFGLAGAAGLGLRLLANLPGILRNPSSLGGLLFDRQNLRLPAFLGTLAGLKSAIDCFFAANGVRSARSAGASGFVSGLSLIFYPNLTIAMYALWKLIEIMYFKGVERGQLPHFRHGDILVYTISCGFVLAAGAICPHVIRKGYWGFINGLTGNHFSQVNRPAMDVWGFDSGRLFRDAPFPALDPRHVTTNPAFIGLQSL